MKTENVNRREFLGRTAKAVAAVTAFNAFAPFASSITANNKRQRLAVIGTGNRGTRMWGKFLAASFNDYVEIVALSDINPKRLQVAQRHIGINAPLYSSEDFDLMIAETKPDSVIIATPDCYHVEYAVRAMRLGCDVICEKPLATEAFQCQQLHDVEIETGKKVITTFNARHGAPAEEIKKFILSGELGRIISVEFNEYLDINHGASYYRRWHGKSKYSGTLLVHKASHHFDQVNWWLNADPVEVHAFGKVNFYGANNSFHASNCRTCSFTGECNFYWDIMKNKRFKELYVDCEDVDGYLRDGCVWDKKIDTYDSMSVEVKYDNDIILTYTLNAYLPYEGQSIAFNGTNGRLDVRLYGRQPWQVKNSNEFRFTQNFGKSKTWNVKIEDGEHGGADAELKKLLFVPGQKDPLSKLAGSRAGIISSLTGIAARQSIETGSSIKINDLANFL